MVAPPEATCDELLRGRIRVWQPRRGHRVSLDALFLADFARRGGVPRRILDLGCGVGVVAIALLAADGEASAVGLELQPELAELARRNVGENRLDGRLSIVEGDLREARELGAFDAVVANPPFFRGRTPPAAGGPARLRRAGGEVTAEPSSLAVARHEVECTLADVAAAARRHVAPRGGVFLIYPAERTTDVVTALDAAGLAPRVLRFVHSVAGEPARRVLVEAAPGWRGGVTVLAPLVVHGADRKTYTPEAAAILGD